MFSSEKEIYYIDSGDEDDIELIETTSIPLQNTNKQQKTTNKIQLNKTKPKQQLQALKKSQPKVFKDFKLLVKQFQTEFIDDDNEVIELSAKIEPIDSITFYKYRLVTSDKINQIYQHGLKIYSFSSFIFYSRAKLSILPLLHILNQYGSYISVTLDNEKRKILSGSDIQLINRFHNWYFGQILQQGNKMELKQVEDLSNIIVVPRVKCLTHPSDTLLDCIDDLMAGEQVCFLKEVNNNLLEKTFKEKVLSIYYNYTNNENTIKQKPNLLFKHSVSLNNNNNNNNVSTTSIICQTFEFNLGEKWKKTLMCFNEENDHLEPPSDIQITNKEIVIEDNLIESNGKLKMYNIDEIIIYGITKYMTSISVSLVLPFLSDLKWNLALVKFNNEITKMLSFKLLRESFTHKSMETNTNGKNNYYCLDLEFEPYSGCNQRLEFLGDAVLRLGTLVYLIKKYLESGCSFGEINQIRLKSNENRYLEKVAISMGVAKLLKKFKSHNDKEYCKDYADLLEAIIGALYIDSGFDKVYKFIISFLFKDSIFFTHNQTYTLGDHHYFEIGNSVLYLLSARWLFDKFRSFHEGSLTKHRVIILKKTNIENIVTTNPTVFIITNNKNSNTNNNSKRGKKKNTDKVRRFYIYIGKIYLRQGIDQTMEKIIQFFKLDLYFTAIQNNKIVNHTSSLV